jgi:hypothetical protein
MTGEDVPIAGRPRRVVYTALMGQYEQLNEQPVAGETDVEFVCFTDDPELRSDSWTIRLIEPRFPLDSIRSARYIKVLGPTLLTEYDETLWIDNSVRLRSSPDAVLDSWLAGADLAIPTHSYRSTVIGEFDTVATDGYDDPARVYEQLIHYSTLRDATLQERPYWTALLARRRVPLVDSTMSLWYDHLLRYSRRDQLSINFVIGAVGVMVNRVEIDNMESEWHEWPVRTARKWNVAQDRMAAALRIPAADLGRLENVAAQARAELAIQVAATAEESARAERAESASREIRESSSWKITAPLRSLVRFLRRA